MIFISGTDVMSRLILLLFFLFFLLGRPFQKSPSSVISSAWDEIWQKYSSNANRLTGVGFSIWRHF